MNDLRKISYNCQKATLLIEKKQLARLTLREKLELKIHLAGCSVCKLFQRQSVLINKQVKSLFHSSLHKEHFLNDQYKKDMQEQIEKRLKQS